MNPFIVIDNNINNAHVHVDVSAYRVQRLYLFNYTSHLCLVPSTLVCSALRSVDVLSWTSVRLRSLFSTMGSVVLGLPCLPTPGLL